MEPLSEKTILLTGATDGIGLATARRLAHRGAGLVLHGRNQDKGEQLVRGLRADSNNERIDYVNADLASLAETRGLAEEMRRRHTRLDILINNAGIGAGPDRGERAVSADAFELRFAVNYLAPFLLTLELLPLLERAGGGARIVNVASGAQSVIDLDDVMMERDYDGWRAYSQSKLALVMFTFELAPRIEPRGITVNALHPGTLLDTKMVREGWGAPAGSPEEGAGAIDFLATAPHLEGLTGEYFDQMSEARADPQAYDEEARRRLWRLSLELTGAPEP